MLKSLTPQRTTWLLGVGGLLPPVALAALALLASDPLLAQLARAGLGLYGLSIISFVGAINWGISLASNDMPNPQRQLLLVWGVAPSLIAWGCFSMESAERFYALAGAAVLAWAADLVLRPVVGLPTDWYRLRTVLTLGLAASLCVGGFSVP
ncbi:MAG: DUF3429 family protein [Betaproteobacteria bacterium]|nr:DUF3429 family protein [Betaproteobacteria bacterium]